MAKAAVKERSAKETKPVETAEPVEAAEGVDEGGASFDWQALPDLEPVEYVRPARGGKPSVIESTPEPIRAKVQESYDAYMKRLGETPTAADFDAARDASFRRQPLASEDQAQEFARLIKRYAKAAGMTLRDVRVEGSVVYFRAKPYEARPRSESAEKAA